MRLPEALIRTYLGHFSVSSTITLIARKFITGLLIRSATGLGIFTASTDSLRGGRRVPSVVGEPIHRQEARLPTDCREGADSGTKIGLRGLHVQRNRVLHLL